MIIHFSPLKVELLKLKTLMTFQDFSMILPDLCLSFIKMSSFKDSNVFIFWFNTLR